ncbi:MAG TPA: hypothetical protein PKJ97_03360, partial [Candidatus Bilamarchaeaceae archaeon]|nr:hypothetical protein [Candidatus Bilamarchaeaceae archaeon]
AVEEALGVDYDLFNRAIYSDQNNIGYFLDLDAGKRKKEMDGLMGLDRFEEVRANTVRVMNRIEGERKALEARYDGKRHGEIAELLERKRKMIGDAAEEEGKADGDTKAAAREAGEAEKRLLEMGKNKDKKEAAGRALDRERGRVEALRADVAGKDAGEKELSMMRKELAEIEKELDSANEGAARFERAARMLAQEVGNLEGRLREAELAAEKRKAAERRAEAALAGRDGKALEKRLGDAEKEMLELAADEKALLRGAAEMEAYAGIIKEKCPVCGTDLGEGMAAKIKGERAGEIGRKRGQAAAAHKRIAELGKERDGIRKVLEEVREAGKWVSVPAEGAGKISEMLGAARKKCSEEEGKIAGLRALRASLEKRREKAAAAARDAEAVLEKRKALASAERRALELEKEFSSIIFNDKEYAEAGKAVRELMVRKERAEGRLRETRKE